MMRLGILDQSPVRSGGSSTQAIAETVFLAEEAERLGYARYWLGEHHNAEGLASSAPEVLMARIAAGTSTIRIGGGGIMLRHYSPLKVAETFRTLETLYPGRIDLGIRRAPGTDRRTAQAMAYGAGGGSVDAFPNRLGDLLGFLTDSIDRNHALAGVRAMPAASGAPDVWVIGSTDQSATLAAQFSCGFGFAHFLNDRAGAMALQAYSRQFRVGKLGQTPRVSVLVSVLCAETEVEAQRLALSQDLWQLWLERGVTSPVPSVEDAQAHMFSYQEKARVVMARRRQVIGAPEQVRDRLLDIAETFGAEDLLIMTTCHDFSARRRSYALLADAFGLKSQRPPSLTVPGRQPAERVLRRLSSSGVG